MAELTSLTPGMQVIYGGNQVATVSPELADAFTAGDELVVVQTTGDLIHIPADVSQIARDAVGRAAAAFSAMNSVSDAAITDFYNAFADRLADDDSFAAIAAANEADIASAKERGRSTTRLELTDQMRADMIDGLRGWAAQPAGRGPVSYTHLTLPTKA